MAAAPTSIDLVAVAIELTGRIVDSNTAQLVGPYAVIILGAVGGATWSASARGGMTSWETLRHVLWMVGLALIATLPLAEFLASFSPAIEARFLLAPVAAAISARPDWIIAQIKRALTPKEKQP